MEQKKIGEFILALRKEKGYTQKELADILGISDKTISKWETGRGFPDVSLLLPLCNELGINVNELLSGERISDVMYKEKAEENLVNTLNNSAFTLKDKIKFFKKKWIREHIAMILVAVVMWFTAMVILKFNMASNYIISVFGGLIAVLLYVILYNHMMSYVEKNAFDGKGMK